MESLVNVQAGDGKKLFGWLVESENPTKTILVNIHGTASNFYTENFIHPLVKELASRGIATLATNNRGANALEGWEKGGSADEIFEDCLLDIDAWVSLAASRGYERIILSGHSLGTEKVVYYMAKGENRGKIKKIVLLAPADSYGYEMQFMEKIGKDLLAEARELASQGRGHVFLTSEWYCHGGAVPKSADSFLNFFSPLSELSKALPFREGKLPLYSQIDVPIMAVISDNESDEYTVVPINEALALMKKENPQTQTVTIPGTNHTFDGKESELAKLVSDFVNG